MAPSWRKKDDESDVPSTWGDGSNAVDHVDQEFRDTFAGSSVEEKTFGELMHRREAPSM